MTLDEQFLKHLGGVRTNSLRELLQITNVDEENMHSLIPHSSYFDTDQICNLATSKQHCFSILSSNIESINAKFGELEIFIEQLNQVNNFKLSAICLQESWLSTDDDISPFQLDGYTCISQGKTCSNKGGLIIYLNETFKYKPLQNTHRYETWEGQYIQVHGGGLSKKIIIGNIYRPPKDLNENYKFFTYELSQVLSHFEVLNADTIIAGDTNVNLLKILEKEAFSDFLILLYHTVFILKSLFLQDFQQTMAH